MKEAILPLRENKLFDNILEVLMHEGKSQSNQCLGNEASQKRRARPDRKEFIYYTRLFNNDTLDIVGYLSDISSGGFKLDTREPITINREFRFIMNLTSAVADKPFMKFTARSRWCRVDPLDPFGYNVGFQLIHISQEDVEIFDRMIEKYGREPGKK